MRRKLLPVLPGERFFPQKNLTTPFCYGNGWIFRIVTIVRRVLFPPRKNTGSVMARKTVPVRIIDEDWNADSSGAVRKFVSESQVFPGNDEIIMCCFCHVIARNSAKFCQCRYGTDRQIFLVHVRQPAETLNRHQCVKSWFAAFWKKQSGSANDARNVEKLRHIFIRKMIAFWPLLNLISSMGIPLKEQVFKSRTEGAEAFSNAADLLSLSLFIRKSKEARSFRPGPSGFFFGISAGIR